LLKLGESHFCGVCSFEFVLDFNKSFIP
jgi:hypothetical protein